MTIAALQRLLRDLDSRLGNDLWQPWALDWSDLQKRTALPWLEHWPHRDQLAGWVLSCGDFLRTHGPVETWPTSIGEPRQIVKQLAHEIPWMGRRSPARVKAWRLVRWIARAEGCAPLWPAEWRKGLTVPWPVWERPLKALGWLPAQWESALPTQKQKWCQQVAYDIDEIDPARLWVPLETLLSRGQRTHKCEEILGGCKACPVQEKCPGRNRLS
jgi:hypothetical protein